MVLTSAPFVPVVKSAQLHSSGSGSVGHTLAPLSHTTPEERLHQFTARPVEAVKSLIDVTSFAGKNIAKDDVSTNPSEEPDKTNADKKKDAELAREQAQELAQLKKDQEQIKKLSARDREVKAHEQAHAAVGGQYAGAPSYTYERGPDGVRYAVGGEVPISTSPGNTPEETIEKAQVIRRAALAPAEPSAQDRRVAAEATRMEAEAIQDLALAKRQESQQAEESKQGESEGGAAERKSTQSDSDSPKGNTNTASESSSSAITSRGDTPQRLFNVYPSSVGARLQQSVIAASLDSPKPGDLLQNIA